VRQNLRFRQFKLFSSFVYLHYQTKKKPDTPFRLSCRMIFFFWLREAEEEKKRKASSHFVLTLLVFLFISRERESSFLTYANAYIYIYIRRWRVLLRFHIYITSKEAKKSVFLKAISLSTKVNYSDRKSNKESHW